MRRGAAAMLMAVGAGSASAQVAAPDLPATASAAERRAWVDRNIRPGSFVETDLTADRAYFYDPASFKRQPDGNVVGLIRAELLRPRMVDGKAVRSVRKLVEIDCVALRYRERTVEGFAASNLAEPLGALPLTDTWTDPATAGSPDGRRLFPACADTAAFAKDRAMRFAGVKAAQPPQEATNAAIVAKTAALVAAAGPVGGIDQPPVVWRTADKPALVFDVAVGPRMLVVPAGEFTMGEGRPRHRVRLDRALAVSMFPITFGEYSWFVAETRRPTLGRCATLHGGRFSRRAGSDWFKPGFPQSGRSPATCVGHDDAVAYAAWLSARTGQRYRLLTEAEYEWANRAGTATAYWWGDDPSGGCAAGLRAGICPGGSATGLLDRPTKPNGFGLVDTTGNVASWTSDCWDKACRAHVVRGGSWAGKPADLRSAARARAGTRETSATIGFRVAREL